MLILPAIDLIDGQCVRLCQGDYNQKTVYCNNPQTIAAGFKTDGASYIHIVDLDGAKAGFPVNNNVVLDIAERCNLPIQIGGGIRSLADARHYLEQGVSRIILGTSICEDISLLKDLLHDYDKSRIAVSIDIKNNTILTAGWLQQSSISIDDMIHRLQTVGVEVVIVTDTCRDGLLTGPNFSSIDRFIAAGFKTIVAGGVSSLSDIQRLQRQGAYGAIIGKALYEKKIILREAIATALSRNNLSKRIIACMDIKDGRVVKGINFTNLRDAGDAILLGQEYSRQGADELVFLDITATLEKRPALLKLVKSIAEQIDIPFTVGGGINNLDGIYDLLAAGADKVALGTIAVTNPDLVYTAANQFGSQCITISLDAKQYGDRWFLHSHGGSKATNVNAITHAKWLTDAGAGELLVNSLDNDGMKQGFALPLLQAICNNVKVPVIASSGAGCAEHFLKVFKKSDVDAALGAGIFHFGEVNISEIKNLLLRNGIKVRT